MTWPTPTYPAPLPPPSPPAPPGAHNPPPEQPPSEIRRLLRAVPPAAWVALLGATLVLVAAGIVVSSRWQSSGPELRFAVILLAAVGLTWGAERLRATVPTTAGVIAHVGAFLATPAGIAGASMQGAKWPLCLLVGGTLAILATEVQARRWRRSTLHAGQVAAIALAVTGIAALTGTTAGLVGAIAAVGLMLIGAHRRASGLAIVAVLSPLLWALADAGIGTGSFERAGLVGDRLGWSGPIVGVLAAVVLAITARRFRINVLMLAAAAAVVLGAATGLAAVDAPGLLWWALPALVVMAAEAAWWLLPSDRHRSAIGTIVDVPAALVAVGGVAAPAIVIVADSMDRDHGLAVPAFATAAAVAIAVTRWRDARRPEDRLLTDWGLASVASCVVAGTVALGTAALLTALLSVVLVAACGYLSGRIHPIAVYVPSVWAAVAIIMLRDHDTATVIAGLTALAALTALIAWLRARRAGDRIPAGWLEMAAMASIAATVAALVSPWDPAVVFLTAISTVVPVVVAFDRRFHLWACAVGGLAGVLATGWETDSNDLGSTMWIGWAVLTVALVIVGMLVRTSVNQHSVAQRNVALHVAAASGVVTSAVAAVGVPLPDEQLLGLAMVATFVLSGLAITLGRRTPLDSAAATAGALVVVFSGLDVDPLWVSAAWFVIGLQLGGYGIAARQPLLQLAGSVVAVGAAVSAWFTSGANDWLLEVIEPAKITAGDLWMLIATLTAFAAGVAARRTFPVNSWIAYSGGLVIAGLWLTSVQLDRETVWAIPTALTIGMLAAGIGAWRRLAAPLVGGVLLIATTLLVATGRDLTDLPTWVWLGVGGLGLLGAAVLIERASKHGTEGLRELAARWQ